MHPASKSIKSLIDQFMGDDISLPEIQREHAWSREKVWALIDSIYRGYPLGSILLWGTDMAGATRPTAAADPSLLPSTSRGSPMAGATRPTAAADADDSIAPSHLLLAGQPRLASLAAVISGMHIEMRACRYIVEAPIKVYDMDHPDETTEPDDTDYVGVDSRMFQLKNRKVESDRRWIPVTSLFQKGPDACAPRTVGRNNAYYSQCQLRTTGNMSRRRRRIAQSRQSHTPAPTAMSTMSGDGNAC